MGLILIKLNYVASKFAAARRAMRVSGVWSGAGEHILWCSVHGSVPLWS